MRKNRGIWVLFFLSCVFQVIFFYMKDIKKASFTYMLGIQMSENVEGIPYMEILAICFPIYFIILYFRDYYSFYMKNYGKLCLIRNCGRVYMIGSVYCRIFRKLFVFSVIQYGIWALLCLPYMLGHMEEVVLGMFFYYFTLIFIVSIEIFLCSCITEESAQIILNLYVIISSFGNWMIENQWINQMMFPGKIVRGYERVQRLTVQGIADIQQVLIPLLCIFILFVLTNIRFQMQDIY